MKTRDTEYLYATSRVRALERTLLTKDRLARMLEAPSFDDLLKVIAEFGYATDAQSPAGLDKALGDEREASFSLVASLVPDKNLVDVFRVKYDYHNIKAILKGDARGVSPDALLINAGTIAASALRTHMRQMDYRDMAPIMRAAVEQAREILNRTSDPQLMDFVLDHAYFAQLIQMAKLSDVAFLKSYVRLLIDVSNLRALVRGMRRGVSAEFLRSALIDGGSVDTSRLLAATTAEATLNEMFAGTPLEWAADAGSLAISGEAGFTRFERLCDNALMKLMHSARYTAFGAPPLVAYLAAKEADIMAIRIVTAGKISELTTD
ncbi:MAG: V-type ATPase subunit, partial [Clostridia bacterium]